MRVGKIFTAGCIGGALALIAGGPAGAADPPLGGARISAVEGEALVQPGEGEGWRDAPLNMPLLPGDRLQTGATGRLEVLLSNGTAFRLAPGSSARLVAVPPPDAAGEPAAAEVDLEAGRASVATGEGDRARPAVILDSAGTRLYVYPRSQVRAETVGPDASQVVLREGEAWADSQGTTTSIPLQPGQTLQLGRSGAFPVAELRADGFDRWSDARNRALAAVPATSPYVPAPLAPYTAELNRYGQWSTVPEYGYVWRPTTVAAGWSPFTVGQWLWRAGTWVWVPAESWGYVPFHYGRWRWDPFHGWYWVPPRPRLVVWDPGPVAWIVTPTYVTWIPLAPGEVYYSPWPHRFWSAPAPTTVINVTNITVIRKTFVNAAAPAPVVAVPATTFSTATVVTPTATRVSLASLVANQPARVVTPAALAPAVAERRPADPRSARNGSPFASPNAAPQARGPGPGAAAPAPQAPGMPQALAAPQAPAREVPRGSPSPAPSPNAGRGSGWGREAGRTPETSPAQPREPERPKAERPPTGFTALPAAAPRAVPEPARPAPLERVRPREQSVRPEARIEREQPRAPVRDREFRPAPQAEPARPAPLERSYPREDTLRPQVRTDRERPQARRQEFRPAPHAVEPVRPATPTPVPQAPFQARPSPRHDTPPAAAPPQRQDRPHHVAHAPSPPPPAKPQPHPVLTR